MSTAAKAEAEGHGLAYAQDFPGAKLSGKSQRCFSLTEDFLIGAGSPKTLGNPCSSLSSCSLSSISNSTSCQSCGRLRHSQLLLRETTAPKAAEACRQQERTASTKSKAPVPFWFRLRSPIRFRPGRTLSGQLFEALQGYNEALATVHREKEGYQRLCQSLSPAAWKLLLWKHKRLVHLAAQERLGPTVLDTGAKNPELKELLLQRQEAWITASRIVRNWEIVDLALDWLEYQYAILWPISVGWAGTSGCCPDLMGWWRYSPQRHRRDFIRALAMRPDAPEYNRIASELPDWVKVVLPPPGPLEKWPGFKTVLQCIEDSQPGPGQQLKRAPRDVMDVWLAHQ